MTAHTIVSIQESVIGGVGARKRTRFTITGAASYETGGSAINLGVGTLASPTVLGQSSGFTTVHGVSVCGVSPATSGNIMPIYTPATGGVPETGKLALWDLVAAAEIPNTTDEHLVTWTLEAYGV